MTSTSGSRRLPIWRLISATVVTLMTVAIGACGVLDEDYPRYPDDYEIVADEPVLRRTMQRLEPLRAQLDQIFIPPGTTADPARLHGCWMNDGDPEQPYVTKDWAATQPDIAGVAAATIVEALRGAGWTITGPDGSPDYHQYGLSLQRDTWSAVGRVVANDRDSDVKPRGVLAIVNVYDARACVGVRPRAPSP